MSIFNSRKIRKTFANVVFPLCFLQAGANCYANAPVDVGDFIFDDRLNDLRLSANEKERLRSYLVYLSALSSEDRVALCCVGIRQVHNNQNRVDILLVPGQLPMTHSNRRRWGQRHSILKWIDPADPGGLGHGGVCDNYRVTRAEAYGVKNCWRLSIDQDRYWLPLPRGISEDDYNRTFVYNSDEQCMTTFFPVFGRRFDNNRNGCVRITWDNNTDTPVSMVESEDMAEVLNEDGVLGIRRFTLSMAERV